MLYRRYGRTGLNLSVLSFGAMRIPFDESTGAEDRARGEANAIATVRRALELGINHIDTARAYGNSERLVGLALRELGRDKFYLTTKIPVVDSYDEAMHHIDDALRLLQTDHIDVVDLHGINNDETLRRVLGKTGCVKAVQQAVRDGKVGHMAFSSHAGPDVIIPALESGLFSAVSMLYWYTHPRNALAAQRAAALDIGVLILSTAEKGGLLFRPTEKLSATCAPAHPLGLTHRWLLAQPGVTTLSVGAAVPGEFDLHVPGADGPDRQLTPAEQEALARWQKAEHDALGATRCTLCYGCMPCPQQVAIPEILRLRNLAVTFDMQEFGQMRYNLLGHGGDWFPGQKADRCNRCGKCLARCPEKLAIPDLLAQTHQILEGEERRRLWK